MLSLPRSLDEAGSAEGEIRAGGTDLQERRRSGVAGGPLIDLRDLRGLDLIKWPDGAARIGALVRIATLASDGRIRAAYPGLAAAASILATPQIRAVGTLGGALLQRTRCWYYRQSAFDCYKKGGGVCPARDGNHLYGVCFDLGPCVWPHPSTIGMALLTYDAMVEVHGAEPRTIAALFGDGVDGRRDHTLAPGEVLTGVRLPEPLPGERAACFRAISRQRAEWPLVEASVRVALEGERIAFARVAVGGVASVPLRLPEVERLLVGAAANPAAFEGAAAVAVANAKPLPMTRYKLDLVPATIVETLMRALAATPATSPVIDGSEGGLPWRSAAPVRGAP